MKKKVNIKEITLFVIIVFYIASQILPKEVNNLDEIWNFNFANCIANNLIPYKDFNLIQGPLLPIICSIFLKIFNQEMLVMRVLAIVLDAIILITTYKVMSKIEIKQYLKYITLIILAIIMKDYFTIDYNWATLLIVLIILYLELDPKEKSIKQQYTIGFLAGIAITLKQTTGIIIVVAAIGYKILQVKSKKDFIQYLKIGVARFLGTITVVIALFIYLLVNGALLDYIDYCILGIATFSNKISYINVLIKSKNILISCLSLLPVIYIILFYKFVKNKDQKSLILFIFSAVNLILVYPISDKSHFAIAIVPTLISFMYLINIYAKKLQVPLKEEIITQCFLECFIIVVSLVYFINAIEIYNNQNINLELKHFKYLPISKESIESIKEIGNYINTEEKNVIILDATAALYMIPIDQYNKNYDMFLKGNLGSKGEEGQIQNLKNLQNTQILILNSNYQRNWQNPEIVRLYIQEEKNKIGEIGIFDIYE